MSSIYINYGKNIFQMTLELLAKANIAAAVPKSSTVALKPNLVLSRPADEGATTHAEIAEAVIVYLQDKGIQKIKIIESSWIGDNTSKAFQVCGYTRLSDKYGVELIDLKKDKTVQLSVNNPHLQHNYKLTVSKTAYEADYLINMPVLKAHCQTHMTCCIKNLKGCIPDSEKRRYHQIGLHEPIGVLSTILKPDLNIIDSICGDLTFEEGGNPVESNRIILGFDSVLLDSYCAGLLGYRPEEIKHLKLARQLSSGDFWRRDTPVIELNSHKKTTAVYQKSSIAQTLGAFIDEKSACSACYASLIFALHRTDRQTLKKINKIKIGQGFRDCANLTGLGVGLCTKGCEKNVPGCPPKAIEIYEMLKDIK